MLIAIHDAEWHADFSLNHLVDKEAWSHYLNHMVEHNETHLDRIFHALADPTRRALLQRLTAGECKVGELAEPFDISLAAVSKHVRVLEQAGLVKRRIEGRAHYCRLQPEPLVEAERWLSFYEGFWSQRLNALEAALKAELDGTSPKEEKADGRR
ncbi:ArsR/SmtB family transcription factor [Billgrantia saliphila]|uniref:ArsR/SmtB family transcription factor n=1 Tax=Billgrantia saliphila TaxID=1848458 RepID=UPI001E4D18B7|nr:metalloregulator ArsR/SmtB family transcription factor [Halomonas saliphila]